MKYEDGRNVEKAYLNYQLHFIPFQRRAKVEGNMQKKKKFPTDAVEREKGQLNNNKMADKWNMELPATKTFLPSVLKAERTIPFIVGLIDNAFMFRKSEETIKIE